MTDRLDAAALGLLRSSFASLKSRFQATSDRGLPCKAWLVHAHTQDDGSPPIYGWADGFDLNRSGTAASRRGIRFGLKDGRTIDEPSFRRKVQLTGGDDLSSPGVDAAQLLDDLPADVAARLWGRLPDGTELKGGLPLWMLAVFELANANVVGVPLRAIRRAANSANSSVALDSLLDGFRDLLPEQSPPEFPDWYATLDNFAVASVQAIDILQSWLADELKRETEANSERPKPVEPQAETLTGGDDAGIVAKSPSKAGEASKSVELLGNGQKAQRCQILAYYASRYAELKLERQLTAQEVYDYWKEYGFDPADKDTENAAELAGYELPDSFPTYQSQLSHGRKAFDDSRYENRKGRQGRSIVRGDEID